MMLRSVSKNISTVALVSLLLTSAARAEEKTLDIDALEGVYKVRFQNGDVSGNIYTSEDVLEIVKHSPTTAYFKTVLSFYNGHMCSLHGIAKKEAEALVYRNLKADPSEQCTFKIEVKNNKIIFDDKDGQCQAHSCGSRGGYGAAFPLNSRRKIRYMPTILNSYDYFEAEQEYKIVEKYKDTYTGTPDIEDLYDYVWRTAWLRAKAEQGNASFQHSLASYYDNYGKNSNFTEALKWYQRSADNGYAPAYVSMAHMYKEGRGVEKSGQKALAFLNKAAEMNDVNAYKELGTLYTSGENVEKDDKKAAFWLEKAAPYGDADAMLKLATIYEHGNGVNKDLVKAYIWLARAAKLDSYNDSKAFDRRSVLGLQLKPEQILQAENEVYSWIPQRKKGHGYPKKVLTLDLNALTGSYKQKYSDITPESERTDMLELLKVAPDKMFFHSTYFVTGQKCEYSGIAELAMSEYTLHPELIYRYNSCISNFYFYNDKISVFHLSGNNCTASPETCVSYRGVSALSKKTALPNKKGILASPDYQAAIKSYKVYTGIDITLEPKD